VTAAPRHLLSLREGDLSPVRWNRLLELGETLAGPRGREPLLKGRRFAMVFYNPSLRTRTSFEVASYDLGAHAVYLQVGGGLWQLEHRDGVRMDGAAAEHVKEGIGALSTMVDGIGVRVFAGLADATEDAKDPVLHAIARASPVPVWNLESAMDHPHQGMADALTVRRRFPRRRVKVVVTWAPQVKPLPMAVPHGATLAFAREGHNVVVAHPEGFDLDPGVLSDARRLAEAAGGSLMVTNDRAFAFARAKVVYAKSWGARGNYGDPDAAGDAFLKHRAWMVDPAAMARTDDALFMHCLPVRRNVVVADAVLDSPACVVREQAGARLDVQKASLVDALGVTP
jgi:N-acetylornithine carbamoyltransferase